MAVLRQVARPALGRPTDKRVTQEYLNTRGLPGVPFTPGTDIDLVDSMNDALADLNALVSYADPTLGPALQAALAAATATQLAFSGLVIASQGADYIDLTTVRPGAITTGTDTLVLPDGSLVTIATADFNVTVLGGS